MLKNLNLKVSNIPLITWLLNYLHLLTLHPPTLHQVLQKLLVLNALRNTQSVPGALENNSLRKIRWGKQNFDYGEIENTK